MYPQQYPQTSQAPPPYQNNMHCNEPSVGYFRPAEERMEDFQQLVARYEINHTFATKLRVLEGYEIVFICDDSGSMNTPLGDLSGPFDKLPSR
ncbi:unnamed protein product, partial [Rotaria magnacalcarata]